MWSGPRNLSTAMMRSFGARSDCDVIDEPFYAAYLATTGAAHPMRDAILSAGPVDPDAVEARILGPAPGDAPIFYQKQMSQHFLDGFPRGWLGAARHAILIRAPERVAASFSVKMPVSHEDDLGFGRLAQIHDEIADVTGQPPPVIEAEDIRNAPERMLRALCAALDIPFDPAMLSWPPGRRDTDGIWAPHWYGAVEQSTGFAPADLSLPEVAPDHARIVAASRPSYERLRARKLT